jgi:hypothetical protein
VKLAGAFLALIPLAFGGMEKVWEMRLGDLVKEPVGLAVVRVRPISALAFSPDGRRLAVAIPHLRPPGGGSPRELTRVVILDLANPKVQLLQLDLQVCPEPLAWAPSGRAILICGMIAKTADGTSCETLPPRWRAVDFAVSPTSVLWIDSTHVLRSDAVLDTDCVQTGTWALVGSAQFAPGKWGIADISAEKGWVLVWHTTGVRPRERTEYGIADSRSGQSVRESTSKHDSFGAGIFVPNKGAWCAVDGKRSRCWNVSDGKEIRLARDITGYRFTDAAVSAPRALAERWVSPGFFCLECPMKLDRRAVWDFGTGALVSSWKPNAQEWNSIHRVGEPDRCNISPDGQFVAEGGDGVVRLYRLTP